VGVVAAGCCGEDRRVRRSVEMGEFRWLLCICVVSLVCFAKAKKGGEGGGLFFYFLKERRGCG